MKKILIALDYDPSAEKVAKTGYELATAMKAEVILMHVIADAMYYTSIEYTPVMGFGGMLPPDIVPLADNESLKNSTLRFLEKAKEHLGDDAVKTLIAEGEFAGEIINAAKKEQADIIVMGSHSRRGLEKLLVGSVTEQVLHQSSIPLFIVPTRKR